MSDTKSIFNKIVDISNEMMSEGFLSLYKDDLFIHDKKTLEKETKSGSALIWVLKHGGVGTAMLFTGSDYAKYNIGLQSRKSLFFLIECSGVNEGSVKRLGGLSNAIKEINERPFVLMDLKDSRNDVMKSVFRLGAKDEIPYELRKLNSIEGSVSYVGCKLYGKTLTINILTKSPRCDRNNKWDVISNELDFNCHLSMLMDLSKRDGQKMMFEIKTDKDGCCSQREINEKEYKKLVSLTNKLNIKSGSEMSP